MAFLSAHAGNNKIPLVVNHTRGITAVLIAGISFQRYFEAEIFPSRLHVRSDARYATRNYCIINIVARNSSPLRIYIGSHTNRKIYIRMLWKYHMEICSLATILLLYNAQLLFDRC